MLKGFYPGTFDPPTLGHLEIISRAAALCDHLVVGIGENWGKTAILTVDERIQALKEEIKTLQSVEILPFSGLSTTFAKEIGADILIRGLRSQSDLDYEKQMAEANWKLGGIETLFLLARETVTGISSSLIRELASHGAPLSEYIPPQLEEILHKRLQ